MYIIFSSAMRIRQNPPWLWNLEETETGVPVAPKWDMSMCPTKKKFKKRSKNKKSRIYGTSDQSVYLSIYLSISFAKCESLICEAVWEAVGGCGRPCGLPRPPMDSLTWLAQTDHMTNVGGHVRESLNSASHGLSQTGWANQMTGNRVRESMRGHGRPNLDSLTLFPVIWLA